MPLTLVDEGENRTFGTEFLSGRGSRVVLTCRREKFGFLMPLSPCLGRVVFVVSGRWRRPNRMRQGWRSGKPFSALSKPAGLVELSCNQVAID